MLRISYRTKDRVLRPRRSRSTPPTEEDAAREKEELRQTPCTKATEQKEDADGPPNAEDISARINAKVNPSLLTKLYRCSPGKESINPRNSAWLSIDTLFLIKLMT